MGSTRETVTLTFGEMRRQELLCFDHRRIVIMRLDLAKLVWALGRAYRRSRFKRGRRGRQPVIAATASVARPLAVKRSAMSDRTGSAISLSGCS